MKSPLLCIVTGCAQGGTSVASQLLLEHPLIDGFFEIGFLAVDSPKSFAKQLKRPARVLCRDWGIDGFDLEFVCNTDSFFESYKRLLERSKIENKKCFIYDKFPGYLPQLPEVMSKVDVPCICVARDPRLVYESQTRKNKEGWPTVNWFVDYYNNCTRSFKKAKLIYGDRLLLVRYEEFVINPVDVGKEIFNFLGFEFEEEFLKLRNCNFEDVNKYKDKENEYYGIAKRLKCNLDCKTQREILSRVECKEWVFKPLKIL